jgi:Na+/H+-dicarboxylate symporter
MHLRTKILLGLVLGAAAGIVSQIPGVPLLRDGLILIEPFGEAFIRLITMVVVPLVVGSLFVGTASVGDVRRLERLGGRTLGFFLASTVIAATIGLALGLLGRPGVGMDPAVRDALSAEFQGTSTDAATAAAETAPGLVQILVEMIPMNPFEAAAEMDLLPLIIAVVIFGAAANLVVEESRQHLVGFFRGVNDLSMVVIGWVMKLAPYAVFALIGSVVARFGTELLESLLFYSALVVAGLLIHALGVLGLALRVLAHTGIGSFYRSISDAAVLAFSTSSSNATLPVSMEVAEEKLGIDESVASFVLPLGATLNMNGSALYKALTAVFVAQVYGLALTPGVVLTIVVTATLAAMAGAGVPGSSLVTTLIVLNAIGLGPQAAAGIALVLGMDRILDMARTTVNVVGDLTCAAYISRFDGSGTAPAGPEFG